MYRSKEWRKVERRKEKQKKKISWYKKGGYSSVIFIPATPQSTLKRALNEDIKASGLKIKIIEKTGISMKSIGQNGRTLE